MHLKKPVPAFITGLSIFLALFLFLFSGNSFAETDTVILPAKTKIIETESFYGDTSLSKVVLNENVLEIRSKAFANSSVMEINLPASLTFIADDAFDHTALLLVTAVEGTYAYQWAVDHDYIDDSFAYSIHNGEYASIDGLNTSASEQDIVVPEYIYRYDGIYPVEEISAFAFQGNSSMESISLPSTLRMIGDGAFQDCANLTQVIFSEQGQLETTGTAVFKGCVSLEKFQ